MSHTREATQEKWCAIGVLYEFIPVQAWKLHLNYPSET